MYNYTNIKSRHGIVPCMKLPATMFPQALVRSKFALHGRIRVFIQVDAQQVLRDLREGETIL